MRIDVIGLPASGKSTFAQSLANKYSIPHVHLDQFWFESGGKQGRLQTPNLEQVREQVRKKTLEATEGESWVSDGTYLHVQDILAEKADTIIFLNIPLHTRLWAHFKRVFMEPKKYQHHNQLSLWDDITFFKEIIKRNISSKPKLLKFVHEHQDKVVVLRSWKDMDWYIQKHW